MSPYDVIADWSNRMWPLLANHLWQSTLFSLLALAAAASLGRAPALARYTVWLTALFKFALPSALLFFLAAQAGFDLSSISPRPYHSDSGTLAVSPLLSPVTSPAPDLRAAAPLAGEAGTPGAALTETTQGVGGSLCGVLTCLWLAGCGVLSLSWLRKSRGLSASLKRGREVTRGREADALRGVRSWFGMRREVRLLITPAVSEPGVWGVWRPVVLLPDGVAERLDDGELEAIFMHELSHVERWDNLAGVFQRALCCLFWFHPVIWMINRRLLAEREQACDDAVVRLGGASEVYANGIAKVCRYCLGWEVAGLAKVTGSDLRKRIERIISHRAGKRMSAAQVAILATLPVGALMLSLASGEGKLNETAFRMDGAAVAATDTRFVVRPTSPRLETEAGGHSRVRADGGPRGEDVIGHLSSKESAGQAAPPDEVTETLGGMIEPPGEVVATTEFIESKPAAPGADSFPPAPQDVQAAQPNQASAPSQPNQPPAPSAGTIRAAVVNASDVDYGDLRRLAGRYEVDPKRKENFVLDITLEGDELWLKPSHSQRRRLIRRSETDFTDSYNEYRLTSISDDSGRVVGLRLNSWGANVTARKLALPAPSLQGNVTFRLRGFVDARVVAVAGDFNKWNQSQLLFAREGGEWVCRVSLPAGTYQYKFIVDGNWLTDPNNPKTVHDERGFENSLLRAE